MSNKITLLPDYLDNVQQSSIEFYRSATNLLDVFDSYLGQLQVSISFERSKSANDVITTTSALYQQLNDNNFEVLYEGKTYSFDNIFKLFYIEKFQALSDSLKTLITKPFSGNNTYFINFSDDTGNITSTTNVIDNTTSPYFDTYDELFVYPNSIPNSVFNKVSKNEVAVNIVLNLFTDALLKTNLNGLQSDVNIDTAKTSHGENLVTDNLYVNRLYKFKDPINSQLKIILGNMADFINFFKNVNYRDLDADRKSYYLKYVSSIEGVAVRVDALKNVLNAPSRIRF